MGIRTIYAAHTKRIGHYNIINTMNGAVAGEFNLPDEMAGVQCAYINIMCVRIVFQLLQRACCIHVIGK